MLKEELKKVKYYLVFLGLITCFFIYASFTGWRIFGSDTEKWSPTQEKEYHK